MDDRGGEEEDKKKKKKKKGGEIGFLWHNFEIFSLAGRRWRR